MSACRRLETKTAAGGRPGRASERSQDTIEGSKRQEESGEARNKLSGLHLFPDMRLLDSKTLKLYSSFCALRHLTLGVSAEGPAARLPLCQAALHPTADDFRRRRVRGMLS